MSFGRAGTRVPTRDVKNSSWMSKKYSTRNRSSSGNSNSEHIPIGDSLASHHVHATKRLLAGWKYTIEVGSEFARPQLA